MTLPRSLPAFCLFLGVLMVSACSEDNKPKGKGKLVERFRSMDKNGDGVLTSEEVDHPQLFKQADRDQDGKVTPQEAREFVRARAEARQHQSSGSGDAVVPAGTPAN